MNACRSPRVCRALTLLEVIIAIVLITMLMGSMFTFFWQVIQVRDTAAAQADRIQIARLVLDQIANELRACVGAEDLGFPIEQPLIEEQLLEGELVGGGYAEEYVDTESNEVLDALAEAGLEGLEGLEGLTGGSTGSDSGTVPLLIGDRRNITFLTARLPSDHQYDFWEDTADQPPAQHDLTQVSYWLWVNPEEQDDDGEPIIGGIVRTEKRTLNQFTVELDEPLDVRNDIWSHELGYLEFRYFDGVEWAASWNVTEGNSLPQLVQITVGFESATSDELDNRDLEEYPIEEPEYQLGDGQYHPDRYSIIVRIPAADRFYSSRMQRMGEEMTEQFGVEGLE